VRERAKPSSLPSYDADARKRLWEISEALIDSRPAGGSLTTSENEDDSAGKA
jgi:hypothetical protein